MILGIFFVLIVFISNLGSNDTNLMKELPKNEVTSETQVLDTEAEESDNVAGIGYIYGRIKGQLKNQDALIQTLKDDFNDKFNNFKISVAENSVKVENNQKQLMNALKDDFNEKFNNFKESVAEHFVRVEKKQDIHNHSSIAISNWLFTNSHFFCINKKHRDSKAKNQTYHFKKDVKKD